MSGESAHDAAPAEHSRRKGGWRFAAFRQWREREHPRSSYQIAPAVWRPESLARIEGESGAKRRALKSWEPRLTGFTCSERALYLVEVVAELGAESVGKLLYLADLFRHDPDYAEHRDKRLHLPMLAREAAPSLLEFARRRRIRVVVLDAENEAPDRIDPDRSARAPVARAEVAGR